MKTWKDVVLKVFKFIVSGACIIGFFFNSLANFQSFLRESTTITLNKEISKDGFKAPSVTICGRVPFRKLTLDNVTYESYDADSLTKDQVIKGIMRWSASGSNKEADATVEELYTITKGKCFIIRFNHNVQHLHTFEIRLAANVDTDAYILEVGYEAFLGINWNPYNPCRPVRLGQHDGVMKLALEFNVYEDLTHSACMPGNLTGKITLILDSLNSYSSEHPRILGMCKECVPRHNGRGTAIIR